MSSKNKDTADKPAIIPAATVLMLRETDGEMEVFMVVRHHQIDFASGALVFPGGKTDAQDSAPELAEYLRGASEDSEQRAIEVSSVREAFEECGVLLARPVDSEDLIDGERLAGLEHYRAKLVSGEISMAAFLAKEQLVVACDLLTHFAHWVTPSMMPKRFDTHFYLARAPEDHVALHDGSESVDSVWIRPRDALAGAESGKYTIIFPTLRNVWKLAQYGSVDEALASAASEPTVRVEPVLEKRDDGTYLCIPAEAGYDLTEEKMPERAG